MIPLAVFSATAPAKEIATAVPPLPTLIDPETATAVADRVVVVLPGTAPDCAVIARSPVVAVRRDPLIVTTVLLSVVSFNTSAPATESDPDTLEPSVTLTLTAIATAVPATVTEELAVTSISVAVAVEPSTDASTSSCTQLSATAAATVSVTLAAPSVTETPTLAEPAVETTDPGEEACTCSVPAEVIVAPPMICAWTVPARLTMATAASSDTSTAGLPEDTVTVRLAATAVVVIVRFSGPA